MTPVGDPSMSKSVSMPSIGEVIAGRFELLSVLGRGGGGEVFKAKQLNIEREIAIKLLPTDAMSDLDAMRRFEREARLISRLRHPNTITVYEFDRTPSGLLYIAMELVEGVTLKDLLKAEMHLPPQRAVRILRQILKSLAEAHSIGIIHRDIKPANIMLCDMHGERDFVKVLDFGVATVLSDSKNADPQHADDVTVTMEIVGTPQYMAPEQFRSQNLTATADLYSLGIVAYEMLAGYTPFAGDTLNDILIKHLFDPVPSLPKFVQDYPALVEVVTCALEKKPEDRFPSAEAMLGAVKNWGEKRRQKRRPSLIGLSLTDAVKPPPTEAPTPPSPHLAIETDDVQAIVADDTSDEPSVSFTPEMSSESQPVVTDDPLPQKYRGPLVLVTLVIFVILITIGLLL